tara:strand:- start:2223 stop:2870 length:648 start_codon:yes stop_codon:yes gene_type:complete
MKFFIIVKQSSVRVPNKNFRPLGDKPLWGHLVDSLRSECVYIDTDSASLIKECENIKYVTAYPREQKFIDFENDDSGQLSPALMMIDNFLQHYVEDENEVVVTTHVTSPFLKKSTIMNAALKLKEGYDSVQSCVEHHEFAYFNGLPVNFDPSVIQKTQNLPPVIMGNGAFFIFTKKTFNKNKNRSGSRPYFYPLSFKESIEIDTEEDFELAEKYL